jgi:uncharacterized protein YeeX (DUF496 family)
MTASELLQQYPLQKLIEALPEIIIRDKKKFYLLQDVFKLYISKNMNVWECVYLNNRDMQSLYEVRNKDFSMCIAEMISVLIQEKHIEL